MDECNGRREGVLGNGNRSGERGLSLLGSGLGDGDG